jgi:hypothetical protein
MEEPVEADGVEYPKGSALGFIVIALVLSVFLISLDLVCLPTSQTVSYPRSTN